jgi:hypothetical protein
VRQSQTTKSRGIAALQWSLCQAIPRCLSPGHRYDRSHRWDVTNGYVARNISSYTPLIRNREDCARHTDGSWVLRQGPRPTRQRGQAQAAYGCCVLWEAHAAYGRSVTHKNTLNKNFSQYSPVCNPPIMSYSIELAKINKAYTHSDWT